MKNKYFWTFLELQKGTHFGVPFWSHFGLILGPILESFSDLSEAISRCILVFFLFYNFIIHSKREKQKEKTNDTIEKKCTKEINKDRKNEINKEQTKARKKARQKQRTKERKRARKQ